MLPSVFALLDIPLSNESNYISLDRPLSRRMFYRAVTNNTKRFRVMLSTNGLQIIMMISYPNHPRTTFMVATSVLIMYMGLMLFQNSKKGTGGSWRRHVDCWTCIDRRTMLESLKVSMVIWTRRTLEAMDM